MPVKRSPDTPNLQQLLADLDTSLTLPKTPPEYPGRRATKKGLYGFLDEACSRLSSFDKPQQRKLCALSAGGLTVKLARSRYVFDDSWHLSDYAEYKAAHKNTVELGVPLVRTDPSANLRIAIRAQASRDGENLEAKPDTFEAEGRWELNLPLPVVSELGALGIGNETYAPGRLEGGNGHRSGIQIAGEIAGRELRSTFEAAVAILSATEPTQWEVLVDRNEPDSDLFSRH